MTSLPNLFGGIASNALGGFEPNPLDNFNTYSPNIEIIIAPESMKGVNAYSLPPGSGIVIASTGKTANYYIDKAQLKGIPVTSNNSLQSVITEVILEVIEPMGFTFFDRFFAAVFNLNWQLATDAIIFLSISYNGWNVNGSPSPRFLKSTWKCKLTDIKVDVESSASKYTIKMIPIGVQEGLDTQNHIVDRSFNVEVKESFIDTVAELEKVMNETASNRDPERTLGEPDKIYKLVVGQRLSEINPKLPINIVAGSTTIQLGPDGKARYMVNNGTNITDMLTRLALNIIGISKIMNPRLDENYEEDISEPLPNKLMQHFVVVPSAGYDRFDSTRNRYVRVLEYTIDLMYRPDAEQQSPNTLGSMEKAKELIKNNLLKKRYDYFFTGQNNEVLDLKIDFNASFSHLISTYSRQDAQSQAPNITEELRNIENGLDRILAKISNLSNIFGNIGSFFGLRNMPTERLMETLPPSGILANLINFTQASTVNSEFSRSGISVPSDNEHRKNVDAAARVDARANDRNSYKELNQQFLSSMAKLELTIRGDPYWIGKTYFNDPNPVANFYSGTPYLYLKFKLGEQHDPRTGLTPNLGNVTFSGIYQVTQIISVYEGGKFTQKLDGTIDTSTLGVQF